MYDTGVEWAKMAKHPQLPACSCWGIAKLTNGVNSLWVEFFHLWELCLVDTTTTPILKCLKITGESPSDSGTVLGGSHN